MAELVAAELLVVVDVGLLQHFLADLIHLLRAELALSQQLDRLLDVADTHKVVLVDVEDLEGVVELDLPGRPLAQRGEEKEELIEAQVAATVGGKYLANPLSEEVRNKSWKFLSLRKGE